jgi:hypothetical protein
MDEIVILCCNTHGDIYPEFIDRMETVPEGVKLYRINAVAFGVPNIQTISGLNRLNQIIKKYIQRFKYQDESFVKFVSSLSAALKNESNKEYNSLYKDRCIIDKSEKFIRYKDQRFTLSESHKYINKVYSKFDEGCHKGVYFNRLMLYKTDGYQIDILHILKTIGYELNHIKLSELVELLHGFGYKNILLVDLTCSTCDIDERSERIIRRSINQLCL